LNTNFAKYDPVTGRIAFAGDLPEEMIALQGDNIYVGKVDTQLDYIVSGQCVPRPVSPVVISRTAVSADGTDTTILSGVPLGAQVRVTGPTSLSADPATQSDVTLTFAIAGQYQISVDAFPYLTFGVIVDAS